MSMFTIVCNCLPSYVMLLQSYQSTFFKETKTKLHCHLCISTFKQLPVDQINEALKEYDDAARMKDLNIRNHYAYFNGLLRRFLSVHEKVKAGLCTGPMGINLSDRVRVRKSSF